MTNKEGFISAKCKDYFEFSSEVDEEILNIPFSNDYFLLAGDIITIQINLNGEFVQLIEKKGNKHLNTLTTYKGSNKKISGFVFKRNAGGFLVSFNGYRCFLPNYESSLNPEIDDSQSLLGNEMQFNVIEVKEGMVILSRKKFLKAEKEMLKIQELKTFEVGQEFFGVIEKIEDYGLFIRKKNASGLLHISEVFYFLHNENQIEKAKQFFKKIFNEVNKTETYIHVEVKEIYETKYSLTCDISSSKNKAIYDIIHKVSDMNSFSLIKNNIYPKKDEITNIYKGMQFHASIENIVFFGLFVRKFNLSGLIHINTIYDEKILPDTRNEKLTFLHNKFQLNETLNVEILEFENNKIILKIIT